MNYIMYFNTIFLYSPISLCHSSLLIPIGLVLGHANLDGECEKVVIRKFLSLQMRAIYKNRFQK